MNCRITAVLFSTLFVSQVAFSQTKREVLEDDPKLAPNLRLELTPVHIAASLRDNYSSADYGVRASYRANNRFAVSGEYRRAMTDVADKNSSYYHGGKTTGYAFEGIVTYFFANKEKEVEEWMPVKAESVGYRTVEVTVDPVPMTRLALYGVRGGVGKMVNSCTVYGTSLVSVNNPAATMEVSSATPLLTTGYAFAGLNASRIKNTKVKYPVYGTRRKQNIREYFLDFIYATSNAFSPVEGDNDNGVKTAYRMDLSAEANQLMKYGARIGFFSTPTGRTLNLGYGFEVGSMPRARSFTDGIYWSARLTLSLTKSLHGAE